MKPRNLTLLLCGLLAACAQTPNQPFAGASISELYLPEGPWASVDQVPVPTADEFVPTQPQRHILTSGVTVLLMPNHELPIVEFNLRMRGGSWADPAGKTGLAEMTAAVVRSGGSEQWPGDKLDDELDFLGSSMEFAADNDSTSGGFSCLPADFDSLLDIFDQLLDSPLFPEDKIETVRGQMLAEIAARNDDAGGVADRESARAYFGVEDPRVRRQEVATVNAIQREDLLVFHRVSYGSRRALITVYGDFAESEVLNRLEDYFGAWLVQSAKPVEVPINVPASYRQVFLLDRDDVNQTEIRLLHQGIRRSHPDYPALRLGAYIVGAGGFGNRMMTRIRRELGLAYGAGAYWAGSFEQQGLFRGFCATSNASALQATSEMLKVLTDFLSEGVGSDEFEHAKMRLLNAEVFDVDTSRKVLARIAGLEFYGYPWNFYENASLAIAELTAEQVIEACSRHLDPANLSIFVAGNVAEFEGDFATIGEVQSWNVDLVTTAHEGAGEKPSDQLAAAQLAEHLLSSHGGRKAWENIGAVWERVTQDDVTAREIWMVHPNRFRAVIDGADGSSIEVLDGESGWVKDSFGVRHYQADEIASRQIWFGDKLPMVLMRLARDEYQLSIPQENVLMLVGFGSELLLHIGEDGLCRSVQGAGGTYLFNDYALSGAVMMPQHADWSFAEESVGLSCEWKVNPELSSAWFQQP